jgi:hypothetical protein
MLWRTTIAPENRVTTATDEFYRDIIEGLAIHSGSTFQHDVLATISRYDERDLGAAFNKNQIASKMWLADALLESAGPEHGNITILGGWFGALAAVLLHDRRFSIGKITSVDIDPRCEAIALSVNATHVRAGRFSARTADMFDLDYGPAIASAADPRFADLVINTSCEHLPDFDRWYRRVPPGQRLVLQSNDYFACDQHVNCVPDLAAFEAQAPMREVQFAGERRMKRYVRFMLIGRK